MELDERSSVFSVEFETASLRSDKKECRPSMLYSILPAVVQKRIPTLPSLRRTISELHSRSIHAKGNELRQGTITPGTPPPRYTSRPGSGSTTPTRDSIASTEITDSEMRNDSSERPGSSRSLPPPFSLPETKTGIHWKYANHGVSLLTQSYHESHTLAIATDDASAIITRQMYLHGMTYLLRGIPTDLTPEELLSLEAAVPASILHLQCDPNNHALVPVLQQPQISEPYLPQNASILHRITATVVFQTFLFIQFLLPYIKLLVGHAYRFEKEHKVTQRCFNKSISTVDELGRRGLQLSQSVCQMNDGKVGQAINDLTFWWIRGLTGGVQQGISDGVLMIGSGEQLNSKKKAEKVG